MTILRYGTDTGWELLRTRVGGDYNYTPSYSTSTDRVDVQPLAGATLEGVVYIGVSEADDATRTVSNVKVFVDDPSRVEPVATSGLFPAFAQVDTNLLADGARSFVLEVEDDESGLNVTVPVTATVANTPVVPATPSIDPVSGTYTSVTVTITAETTATVYYTTDGSEPSTSSTVYTAPFAVATNTVVQAIAVRSGVSSAVASATYTLDVGDPPAPPAVTPSTGTYGQDVTVIMSGEAGATIYYTTDGSTPDATDTEYTGPVTVSSTTTVKAVAINGSGTSGVTTRVYTISVGAGPKYLAPGVTSTLLDAWTKRSQGTAVGGQTYSWLWNARIVAEKNAFMNRGRNVWAGPTANNPGGCVQATPGQNQSASYVPLHSRHEDLECAAFFLLCASGWSSPPSNLGAMRDKIVDELVVQANQSGVNFHNTSRWCRNVDFKGQLNPVWQIAVWMTKVGFTYSYMLAYEQARGVQAFTQSQRDTMQNWFTGCGEWYASNSIDTQLRESFPQYRNEVLSTSGNPGDRMAAKAYDPGGGPITRYQSRINNRYGRIFRCLALMGLIVNRAEWRRRARSYVKHLLAYYLFPDGSTSEFHRYSFPNQGWHYSCGTAGSAVTIAHLLALAGDKELLTWGTTEGADGTAGSHQRDGGPKTLEKLSRDVCRYVIAGNSQGYTRYQPGHNNEDAYRIDSITSGGGNRIDDNNVTTAVLFSNDALIRTVVNRTHSAAPPLPDYGRESGGQGNAYGGDVGVEPALLFQYELNGAVDPYPSGGGGGAMSVFVDGTETQADRFGVEASQPYYDTSGPDTGESASFNANGGLPYVEFP